VKSLSGLSLRDLATLGRDLENWIAKARAAGLDDDQIRALVNTTLRLHLHEESA
jgi:GntR family transcriptional regulator